MADRLMEKRPLFLIDNKTVSIDEAFKRNAKECVVVDIFAVSSGSGGAQRSASGKGAQGNSSNSDDEKFLHGVYPFIVWLSRNANTALLSEYKIA